MTLSPPGPPPRCYIHTVQIGRTFAAEKARQARLPNERLGFEFVLARFTFCIEGLAAVLDAVCLSFLLSESAAAVVSTSCRQLSIVRPLLCRCRVCCLPLCIHTAQILFLAFLVVFALRGRSALVRALSHVVRFQ